MDQSIRHVVLAGGFGTLEEQPEPGKQFRRPKLVHPVNGRSLLSHALDVPRLAHDHPVAVVLNGKLYPEYTAEYGAALADIKPPAAVFFQPTGGGTYVALEQAQTFYVDAKHVIVTLGDMPFLRPATIERVLAVHLAERSSVTIGVLDLAKVKDADIAASMQRWGRVPLEEVRGRIAPIGVFHEGDNWPLPDAYQEGGYAGIPLVYTSVMVVHRSMLDRFGWAIDPGLKSERSVCDLVNIANAFKYRTTSVLIEDALELVGVNTQADLVLAQQLLARTHV